jgi:hypothetical protein
MLLVSIALSGFSVVNANASGCAASWSSIPLPLFDCRAYELVSPAYKEGYPMSVIALSEDELSGGAPRLLVGSTGSLAHLQHITPLAQKYELARTDAGWKAAPLEFPEFSVYATEGISRDFSSNLESTIMFAGPPPHEADVYVKKIYLGLPGQVPVPVGPQEAPTAGGKGLLPLGASENLHRVVFILYSPNSNVEASALWPGDTTLGERRPSLYEYEYTGKEAEVPRLVGINNIGNPESVGAEHLISDCGTTLGGFPAEASDAYNAISDSGSVVFFTAVACAPEPQVNEIYARVRETSSVPAHKVSISEPSLKECEECNTSSKADAQYAGASLDGSKVFFTTEQRLLPGALGAGPYLYEYDFERAAGKKLKLLSDGGAMGPRVQGVSRVSEDGSHVYFVAGGILSGANAEHKAPLEGGDNLYVFERDEAHPEGRVVFVAGLVGEDHPDWESRDSRPVQATPDGRFLVFQSKAYLTADQEGQEAGQVFEYRAETGTLVRVSRGQAGYNRDGNSSEYAATIPVQAYEREVPVGIASVKGLAVSADGSRVFFTSRIALSPRAVSGFTNVYEFYNGEVGLISDGHDGVVTNGYPAVELVATDETGQDVFFTTADRLLPQDNDNQIDLYDARMDGGFAPPAPLAPCSGDSCQGVPSLTPPLPVPTALPAPEGTNAVPQPSATVKPARKKVGKPRKHKVLRRVHRRHSSSAKTNGKRK